MANETNSAETVSQADYEDLAQRFAEMEEENAVLRESYREFAALQELARAISSIHDLDHILQLLLDLIKPLR